MLFQNAPVGVPFSNPTVFKIYRQKMCHFRVNRRPISHIFHHFLNVLALCECSFNFCLIDSQIPKTAVLAGLEGLLNLLLQKVAGLADFGEILVFICKTLKMRRIFSPCYGGSRQPYLLLPSTRLVFEFVNWKPRFRQDVSETCCSEEFCV